MVGEAELSERDVHGLSSEKQGSVSFFVVFITLYLSRGTCLWRLENSCGESVLAFGFMDPRNRTRVLGLGFKLLYSLSRVVS